MVKITRHPVLYVQKIIVTDIVHIANLNTQHFEVSSLMLEHGKHVLCEKPLTINEKQTRQLIQLAKDRNLFLMEGVWSRCFPLYQELQTLLDKHVLGEILFVGISFGKPLQHIDRIRSEQIKDLINLFCTFS